MQFDAKLLEVGDSGWTDVLRIQLDRMRAIKGKRLRAVATANPGWVKRQGDRAISPVTNSPSKSVCHTLPRTPP